MKIIDAPFNIALTGLATALCDAEKAIILEAMRAARYNQSKAAELVGLSRGAMRTKLVKHFGGTFCTIPKKGY